MAIDLDKYEASIEAREEEEKVTTETSMAGSKVDGGEGLVSSPPRSRSTRRREEVKDTSKADKNFALGKEILKQEGVPLPDEIQEKKWYHRATGTLMDLLYNFERVGSGTRRSLVKGIETTKKEYQEPGSVFKGNSFTEKAQQQLIYQSDLLKEFKEGIVADRDQTSDGRVLLSSIFGEDKVQAAENVLKKIPSAKKLEDLIIPGEGKGKELIKQGIVSAFPAIKVFNKGGKSIEFIGKNSLNAAYIGSEIITDPLTFVGFGAVTGIVKGVTEGTIKGSMIGLGKISPKTAQFIEKTAQNASGKVGNLYEKIYRKYGAVKAAKEFMGDEQAAHLIDDIKNIHQKPEALAEGMITELGNVLGKKAVKTPGPIKKSLRYITKKMGIDPKSNWSRYMVGLDDNTKAMTELHTALTRANDEATAILPDHLASQVNKTIGTLLDGKVDEGDLKRLQKAFQQGRKKQPKADEIFVPEGKTVADALEFRKAEVIKEGFESGKNEFRMEGTRIARDRRNFKIAQLKERTRAVDEVIKKAKAEAKILEKEKNLSIKSIEKAHKIKFSKELQDKRTILSAQAKSEFRAIRQERDQGISYLKSLKPEGEKALDRSRWMKKRDVKIEKLKRSALVKAHAAKQTARKNYVSMKNELSEEITRGLSDEIGVIKKEYSKRAGQSMNGIPTKWALRDMYGRSKGKIIKEFNQERKFYQEQLPKIKFLENYQNMLMDKADEFSQIFESSIRDLPKDHQKLARLINQVMDSLGDEAVSFGNIQTKSPNYFPRVAKRPRDGWMIFSPEEFDKSVYKMMTTTGNSKFSKQRIAADYASFKNAIQKKGGEPVEDVFEITYQRYLSAKKDQAHQLILGMIPDKIKGSGEASRRMSNYVNYLFQGRDRIDNYLKKVGGKFVNTYSYINKTLLTVPAPAFHMMNAVSGPFMTAYKGGVKALNPKTYVEALGIKAGVTKTIRNKLGETMDTKKFVDFLEDYGAIRTSFTRGDIKQNVNTILNRYGKADVRYWTTLAMDVGQQVEDVNRIHSAYVFWKDGHHIRKAAKLSQKTQFDYTDTNEVSRAIQGLYAFFTWQNKIVPATVKAMIDDPKQFGLYSRVARNFSEGRAPTPEQLQMMSEFDRDQLYFFRDTVKGLQPGYRFNFLPFQSGYSHMKHILNRDIDGYLGEHAQSFSSLHRFVLKQAMNLVSENSYGTKFEDNYKYLPRQYNYMPKTALKALSKVQKALGGGGIKLERRTVRRGLEEVEEERIRVSPGMYDFITGVPTSRVTSDILNLVKATAERHGLDPDDTSTLDLIGKGVLRNEDDIFSYLIGMKRRDFDWDQMKEWDEKGKQRSVEEKLETLGLAGRMLPYFNKDKIKDFEKIKSKVEREYDLKKRAERRKGRRRTKGRTAGR